MQYPLSVYCVIVFSLFMFIFFTYAFKQHMFPLVILYTHAQIPIAEYLTKERMVIVFNN